jgi:hypothetical protein
MVEDTAYDPTDIIEMAIDYKYHLWDRVMEDLRKK